MTSHQVILLTNWQLICERSKFLRGRRKLPDVVASLVLSDAALEIVISILRYWSLRSLYNFLNNAELLESTNWLFIEFCHDIRR